MEKKTSLIQPGNTFGIQFLIRQDKLKDGKAPIYVRITINGEVVHFALKQRWVDPVTSNDSWMYHRNCSLPCRAWCGRGRREQSKVDSITSRGFRGRSGTRSPHPSAGRGCNSQEREGANSVASRNGNDS